MSKNVLITGGTGFFGVNAAKTFRNRGWNVVATDLKPFKQSDDVPEDIKYSQMDVSDKDDVVELIKSESPDIVIHAAAALPLSDNETIRNVNIDGTRNVLESSSTSVEKFVYISSTAVYGTHDKHPITEESSLDGVGSYGDSKIEAERICRDYRNDMDVCILRPKTFIGPYRLGVFEILFDWIEDGSSVPLVGWGNNKYQLLHIDDLMEAIFSLLQSGNPTFNDTYNVGATDYNTMKEDFQALVDYAGNGGRVVGTPSTPARLALRVLNGFNMSPLYPWIYETAHKDSYVEVEKLISETDWNPEYSNQEALIDTYDWYRENSDDYSEGKDHRVAWNQGALRIVKKAFKYI
jgi:nucleoside-diphosphate-sugar epimerase